jgi:hypothetical protein
MSFGGSPKSPSVTLAAPVPSSPSPTAPSRPKSATKSAVDSRVGTRGAQKLIGSFDRTPDRTVRRTLLGA